MKRLLKYILPATALLMLCSCTISYKFNGTNIDYSKVKTMSIQDFPNRAAMVYAPLTTRFNEELTDIFQKNTRLDFVRQNGDLELEGEIVGYDISPQAISSTDGLSSETRLTIRVNVRFTNNTDHDEDFERVYTSYQNFDSSQLLTDVQDALVQSIVQELTENIYNDTVANW